MLSCCQEFTVMWLHSGTFEPVTFALKNNNHTRVISTEVRSIPKIIVTIHYLDDCNVTMYEKSPEE